RCCSLREQFPRLLRRRGTLRSLRSRSCGACGPARWPPLRSSHPGRGAPQRPVPLRGTAKRAFGPGS
ncbi:hypothetical protein ACH4TI_33925, partial [Streptomyces rochei]|uniref:hypothetical protein n=1 Tax=Streptomyces rochei TaxID=1928 RepID=UPI0037BAC5F6